MEAGELSTYNVGQRAGVPGRASVTVQVRKPSTGEFPPAQQRSVSLFSSGLQLIG